MSVTDEELWTTWGEPTTRDRFASGDSHVHVAAFVCGCEARRLEHDVRWILAIGCDDHRVDVTAAQVPSWADF